MNITSHLLESYLKCPTKCFLQSQGEEGTENHYANWVREEANSYRNDRIKGLMAKITDDQQTINAPLEEHLKKNEWRYALNVMAQTENLESQIHEIERTSAEN